MNIIISRGKSIDSGEWMFGFYAFKELNSHHEHFIIKETIAAQNYNPSYFTDYLVIPETVGRGMPKIKNLQIFEGDIFEFDGKSAVVKYGEYTLFTGQEHFGFYLDWGSMKDSYRNDILFWIKEREGKIIGTIYDDIYKERIK